MANLKKKTIIVYSKKNKIYFECENDKKKLKK